MKKVELSGRMQAVADYVTVGNKVCDVGCDHGYVSIYLVQEKVAPAVLAMDVNRGPLLRAKEHVKQYGLEEYITLRLSDGLTAYQKGEAQTLICAGMGGRLLWNILSKEPEKTRDFSELILQPQSEIGLFRRSLRKEGYLILAENMILEDGKFYPIMKVKPPSSLPDGMTGMEQEADGGEPKGANTDGDEKSRLEDAFGPYLLKEKHPVLLQFLHHETALKKSILQQLEQAEENEKILTRKKALMEEIALLEKAKEQMTEMGT